MRQQQYAAVWPRLSIRNGWSLTADTSFYRVDIRNVGIGPAIIKQVSILYQGDTLESFAEFAETVAEEHGLLNSTGYPYDDYGDLLPDMVIPQQEGIELLEVTKVPLTEYIVKARKDDLKVSVQYESIYGERWEVTYPGVGHRAINR